jgi:mannose-1-phosphate guanylyltransferase
MSLDCCCFAFQITIMGAEATRQQSLHYGCLVTDKNTDSVSHYVEKPETYVSQMINCGVYVCSLDVFAHIATVFHSRQPDYNYMTLNGNNGKDPGHISWESDVLTSLAGTGKLYALQVSTWWSQIKTAGSAIYANRHYLELYRHTHPERLANAGFRDKTDDTVGDGSLICNIIPDVHIHPSASISPTATVNL